MESRYDSPLGGVTVSKVLIKFQTQEDLIVEFLTGILQENTAETQTVICVGFAKLLLAGITTKPLVRIFGSLICFGGLSDSLILTQILKTLVILYFAPETSSNQELRQCLTYFFPVYCFSSSINQRRMLEVGSQSPSCIASFELTADPRFSSQFMYSYLMLTPI